MTTGQLIRFHRQRLGLTQKELGEKAGIAEPTIRRYELGKLNPKYETLEKIAGALGVWVTNLIDNSESPLLYTAADSATCTPAENAIAQYMRQLNNAGQQKAVDRVEELTHIPEYQRLTED